jgi:putative DNA primase/helicase
MRWRRQASPVAPIIGDGKIHAFYVDGDKRGSKNGRYQLHLDDTPAGWFGSRRLGEWHRWSQKRNHEMTAAERASFATRLAQMKTERDAEQQRVQQAAAKRAAGLWERAKPATNDHPYLSRKHVRAYGIRALREQLLIPVRDAEGAMWTLQFIGTDGSKKFLTGGRKRGCYFAIGRPDGVLCVCEGYATGASIFEATGHATAIAFDAGNLEPVARALRVKFPAVRIVLCADNDTGTPGNPGLTAAKAAARAVGGLLAVPTFGAEAA